MFQGTKQELQKLMTLVLLNYSNQVSFDKIINKYGESNVYEAYAKCIDNGYIEGGISYVRTQAGEIFVTISSGTTIGEFGQLFINNHQ